MSDKKIKVHTDKRGKDHIDIYTGDPKEEHKSIHINIDTQTGKGNIVDTTNGQKEVTNTQCYLTSACMRHYLEEFDDNCYELSMLRWFRDKFVSKSDIEHYYEIAPTIVDNIERLENNENIFNYIYEIVIAPCVKAIEMGDFEFAYKRYKSSILCLEEEFGTKEIKKGHTKSLRTIYKTRMA